MSKQTKEQLVVAIEELTKAVDGKQKRIDELVEALTKARNFVASICDNTLYSVDDHADYDLLEELEQALSKGRGE